MNITTNPKCSNCSYASTCTLYKRVMDAIETTQSVSDKDSIYSEMAKGCKLYKHLRYKE